MKSKPGATRSLFRIRRNSAPLDFSKPPPAALRHARGLALHRGASITLPHVVGPIHAGRLIETLDLERSARRRFARTIRARGNCGSPPTAEDKVALRTGHPVERIIRFTGNAGTDLIVLSTHGRTELPRALFGVAAERVVRPSPCAVSVVQEHRDDLE